MTNCAKCGAELIGSRKFCAACGAPTDPSSLKRADPNNIGSGPASSPAPAPAPQINVPSTAYGPPVNPFAATASPSSRAVGSPYGPPPATTANPPSNAPPGHAGAPGPLEGTAPVPPVSPLAVSNALSQRGAFQNAAGDRIAPPPASSPTGPSIPSRGGTSPPPPAAGSVPVKKMPGTQLLPSLQNPAAAMAARSPSAAPGSNPGVPSPVKPPPQRTQVMDAASFARPSVAQPSTPNQPAAPPASAIAQPPSAVTPAQAPPASAIAQPPSVPHQPPQAPQAPQPPPVTGHPYGQTPGHAGHAAHSAHSAHSAHAGHPGQWGAAPAAAGWGAPVTAPPAHGGYGFGYAPGARVNVTWSNGQRYPATVSQVSGTQCLVVFPDGQQHWVEMQYLTPG